MTQFQADSPQYQQPKNHYERQIKSAEAGRVKDRKCKIKDPASGKEPYLVSVPDRANRGKRSFALFGGATDKIIDDTDADVESIEDHVARQHKSDYPKPDRFHIIL